MRGRALTRGLVLFTGALACLLVLSTSVGARPQGGGKSGGATSSSSSTTVTTTDGRSDSGGGKSSGGGGSPPSPQAGDASGGSGASTSVASTPPPSPRLTSQPFQDASTTGTKATAADPKPQAPPDVRPLGTVIQGTNTSHNDTAKSGNATARNTAVVQAGPSAKGGGHASQIGDNTVRIIQDSRARSGDAIAGSQVFGSVGSDADGIFFGLRAGRFDDPFIDPDLFFHNNGVFLSDARIIHLEILVDEAIDCLERLRDDPSLALSRICEHRLERLAEAGLLSNPFLFDRFGLFDRDVFFSVDGTHALLGRHGFAFSSGDTHLLFGPLGTSFASPNVVASLGVGGFAASFPGGTASSEASGFLLLAPFGLGLLPFEGSSFHHRDLFLGRLDERLDIDELLFELRLFRLRLEILEHERELILRTIHFHSLLDDGLVFDGCCFDSRFGHQAIFIADDAIFVPRTSFFSSRGDCGDFLFTGRFCRDLLFSRSLCDDFLFSDLFFGDRCFRPVLDLPGVRIWASGVFV